MDQNENKNVELESVEKKATEVKEEVVEAAEKTAEEVKEVAETAKEEVSEAKNPEADGDFKEVVENVKEKAGEATEKAKEVAGVAKEKMEEAAKKVFTEENKEKMSQAVDTVASYNKNSLLPIFFAMSSAISNSHLPSAIQKSSIFISIFISVYSSKLSLCSVVKPSVNI